MWQWASTEQAWWKEATITTDQQIRTWEMAQASPFWKNIAIVMDSTGLTLSAFTGT
jgi:hypothetical protein